METGTLKTWYYPACPGVSRGRAAPGDDADDDDDDVDDDDDDDDKEHKHRDGGYHDIAMLLMDKAKKK